MGGLFTAIAYFPVVMGIVGILAILVYVYLRCKKNPYRNISLVVGLIGIGACLLVICALFLAGFLGLGPVPA